MRHLTALILVALALVQTSSSSYSPSTYTPTPATDPNAQLDKVYNFAHNVAMENLGSNCTRDKVRIRREWYVNRHLPKPLLVKRICKGKGKRQKQLKNENKA
jgi:hypothetical protein